MFAQGADAPNRWRLQCPPATIASSARSAASPSTARPCG
jgi:hypothetical protein